MKRLLVILITLHGFANAQEGGNVFSLKPAVGINGCQIHGDNYAGYDKFGVFGGAAVNARLSERGSFELGFYVSQKGSRKNQNPKNNDFTYYRIHLNYIDIPVIYRRRIGEKYFVTLGPSVSYLISYREQSDRGDWTGMWPFNKFVADVNFGIGGRINERWTIELRATNAVTPARNWGGNFTSRVYYPNPIARMFQKGLYSNIITLFMAHNLKWRNHGE